MQENLKENKNVEEVLNRGYAFSNEINLVFVALARAAGFRAYPVRLAARNRAFFVPERLDPSQLTSLVAEVLIADPQLPGITHSKFCDPATMYCLYGILPWDETDARGIRIDAHDGQLQTTPVAESKDAVVRREAEFQLDAEGNLSGKIAIFMKARKPCN